MDPISTTANPVATSSRRRIRGNDERRDPSPQRHRFSAHQVALCAPSPEKKTTGDHRYLSSREMSIECVATLRGHTAWIRCVTQLPDGRFVSGSLDKTLEIWAPSKEPGAQCVATLQGHTHWINCVLLLPDGRFVSVSSDHTLKIWDPSKEPRAQCVATLQGHTGGINCVTLLPDGRFVSKKRD